MAARTSNPGARTLGMGGGGGNSEDSQHYFVFGPVWLRT